MRSASPDTSAAGRVGDRPETSGSDDADKIAEAHDTDNDEGLDDRAQDGSRAQQRTEWAEDRTTLAAERTFAGWMRTGMASLGVAIGLQAVFGKFEPIWAPKAAAMIFVITAIVMFLSAAWRTRMMLKRLTAHAVKPQKPRRMLLQALMLSLGAVAIAGILLLL